MEGIISWLKKFNISIEKSGKDLLVSSSSQLELKDFENNFPLADVDLPKFQPRPWPGFPVDCLPAIVALSCKTKGKILINNWMFETGLEYSKQLIEMGANIEIIDGQKIIVHGPNIFKASCVTPQTL